MSNVLKLENVKRGNKDVNKFPFTKIVMKKGEATEIPHKVWENLEFLLEKHNINLKYNEVSHEVEFYGIDAGSRNSNITDIYSMQMREELSLSRDEVISSIKRIADKNKYNPFVDMLKEYDNDGYAIIKEVFDTIELKKGYEGDYDFLFMLFTKFLINVVKMANNNFENDYSSQGMLVLWGKQGCRKSTFCKELIPQPSMFKGDKSLNPDSKDSIIENTKYIMVELAELDSTMKADQAKLKQFITTSVDEYRSPFDRVAEKYPRITSFIGTINKKDFLKDETGSRRFWVIPTEKCDIERLKSINLFVFWGAVYSLWKSGEVIDYLTDSEQDHLKELNKEFAFESDITIAMNEKFDWDTPQEDWGIYNITEICQYLGIREKKALKNEMMKRDIEYKVHARRGAKSKKGYKIPMFEIIEPV